MRIFALALVVPLLNSAYAGETVTQKMSFGDCQKLIRIVATQFAVAPINIVETRDERIARFATVDGSVLVTCSRLDRKMVVTKND